MTQPLFDLAKCNVPFVRSVDFRFVSECSIQPPPPPIFDCPEPPKTFRVVPECPSIDGSIYVSVGTEGCVTKRNKITVTKTPRCGGNEEAGCNFFLDIDMTIPIPPPPCPSIKGGSVKTSIVAKGCATPPKNSIKIRKRSLARDDCAPSKPNCVHTIDLDIAVPIPVPPCPSIKGGSVKTSVFFQDCKEKPKNSIKVRKRSLANDCNLSKPNCVHTIDLELNIPVPRPPCPSIKGGSVKTSVFFQDCKKPKNSIKVRKRSLPQTCPTDSKPNCIHTIDVEIDIPIPRPPCPSISGGSISLSITHKDCTPPKNKIKVKKRSLPAQCPTDSKANCVHVIDIDLTIPVPKFSCPKISITNDPAPRPSITHKKTTAASCKNALKPPRCEFTINVPPPPCPVISAGSVSLSVTHATCLPSKKNKIKTRKLPSRPSSACNFAIDLDLTIPVPKFSCPLISITNDPAPKPSITHKKTTAASCKNALTPPRCAVTINIPPPPCPVISAGSVSVSITHATCLPAKKNKIKARKLPSRPSSACNFAIDLDLTIPVPKFSCPKISITNDPAPRPSITHKKTTAASCKNALTPPRCEFTINVPPPPCPVISAGSVSISITHATCLPAKKNKIKARKLPSRPSSACNFAIDLDLTIPVPKFSCPLISITNEPAPKPSITYKKTTAASCKNALTPPRCEFKINIPPMPCPEISKGSFSITETNDVTKPSGLLKVRKLEPKHGSSCRIGIDINIKLPKPPCPEISKGSFSITETNDVTKPSGLLKVRKLDPKPGSSCRFGIDINVKLPKPPCPEISKGSFSITETNEVTKPSGLLKVRKLDPKPGSSCRFGIDLNIKLPKPPCPEISKGSFSITETNDVTKPSGLLKVRKLDPKPGSSCRFGIDLNIKLPKPPCPEISKGSFSITETAEVTKPSGLLKVRKLDPKPGSSCRFGIDLNIKLPKPPCPEISKGSFSITETNDVTKPSGLLKVRKLDPKPGSSCRFGIDLNIKLPKPPCPEISKGSFSITETGEVTKPSGLLKVRKLDPKPGSSCRFGIDLNIKLPKPPCPEISKGSFSIAETGEVTKPSGLLKVRKLDPKPGSSCRFGIDINIKLPKPPCPEISKGSFSITETNEVTKPSGLLKVRRLNPLPGSSCRFGIDINVKLPKPPCPEISIGKFSLRVFDPSGPNEKATGFLRRKKISPRHGSSCREGLELGIEIPVPKELYKTTASGTWTKGSSKSLTIGSATHSVRNDIENIYDTSSYEVIVGKIDGNWVLVNYGHRNCSSTGRYAKDVSNNAVDESSSTSQLQAGDGTQILLNDQGCAKWFKVKKQKIIYDLEAYQKGLKWKQREVWILLDSGSEEPKEIECKDIGAEYIGGTIDLGDYGSGTINVTGDCPQKTIEATITLNTTDCPSGGSGP